MRKKSREVTDPEQILGIISRCDVCRIALNDAEVPYILPLNFFMSHENGKVTLWFHGANEGRKYEVIARNPHCSFEMDNAHKIISDINTRYCTFQYESVIGQGVISIVSEEEKVEILHRLNNRYHDEDFPVNMPSVPNTTVMKLEVSNMTAKSNVGKIKMAETSKAQKYEKVLAECRSLAEGETDMTCLQANIAAVIHEAFGFWWTGFYLVKNGELVLGPFQGPVACTRIKKGRGVCGTSWAENRTLVVPDVHKFPGHIACSSASNSEIVVPIHNADAEVTGVLDIDSQYFDTFTETDAHWLEELVKLL